MDSTDVVNIHEPHDQQTTSPWKKADLDVTQSHPLRKVHFVQHTRLHSLYWGDWKKGITISYTKCRQVGALSIHAWRQLHEETLFLRYYYCTVWVRPAVWLPLLHEIAVPISQLSQYSWWGLVLPENVMHSEWLCKSCLLSGNCSSLMLYKLVIVTMLLW